MIPAVVAEGEDFAKRLPLEEFVADGEVGFVADFLGVGDIHHEPAVVEAENARAIVEGVFGRLEDDAVFVRSFDLVVGFLHEIGGDYCGHGGGPFAVNPRRSLGGIASIRGRIRRLRVGRGRKSEWVPAVE